MTLPLRPYQSEALTAVRDAYKALAHVVNTPLRNNLLVKSYRDFAAGRRTIVFCVDVAHAKDVHHAFTEAGIRAAPVWGELSRDERRGVLARFSAGEVDVVTNCNLLTEGFDEPRVDCVIMADTIEATLRSNGWTRHTATSG